MVFSSQRAGTATTATGERGSPAQLTEAINLQLDNVREQLSRDVPSLRRALKEAGSLLGKEGISSQWIEQEVSDLVHDFQRISELVGTEAFVPSPATARESLLLAERTARLVQELDDYRGYPELQKEALQLINERRWPVTPRERQEVELVRYLVDLGDKQYDRGDLYSLGVLSYGIRAQIRAIETDFHPYVSVGAAAVALAAGYGTHKLGGAEGPIAPPLAF